MKMQVYRKVKEQEITYSLIKMSSLGKFLDSSNPNFGQTLSCANVASLPLCLPQGNGLGY